jgi:hypothetical protein
MRDISVRWLLIRGDIAESGLRLALFVVHTSSRSFRCSGEGLRGGGERVVGHSSRLAKVKLPNPSAGLLPDL